MDKHSKYVKSEPSIKDQLKRNPVVNEGIIADNAIVLSEIENIIEKIKSRRDAITKFLIKTLDRKFIEGVQSGFNFEEVLIKKKGASNKLVKFEDHYNQLVELLRSEFQQNTVMQKLVAGLNKEKKKCIMDLMLEIKDLRSSIKNIISAESIQPNEYEQELLMYLRAGIQF